MLLKFTLNNFRSFKDENAINLSARSLKELAGNVFVTQTGKQLLKVLTTMCLTGGTATGKSNFIEAFAIMRHRILHSADQQPSVSGRLAIEPFLLNTDKAQSPSVFECTLFLNKVTYRYGFRCLYHQVTAEWLTIKVKRREEVVFSRNNKLINIVKRFPTDMKNKLAMLADFTRKDALFLSVMNRFNIEMISPVVSWFSAAVIDGEKELPQAIGHTASLLTNSLYAPLISALINLSAPGFVTDDGLKIRHSVFNAKNKPVDTIDLDFMASASQSAKMLAALAGPVAKTLVDGGICWIDDIDAMLDPRLTAELLDLFTSSKANKKGAQLIIISHHGEVYKKFRKDQLVFVNKNAFGASSFSAMSLHKTQAVKATAAGSEGFGQKRQMV